MNGRAHLKSESPEVATRACSQSARRGAAVRAFRVAALLAPWLVVGVVVWPRRPYYLDLLSHFSIHLAGLMAVIAIGLALVRRFALSMSFSLAVVVIAMLWTSWARPPATSVELTPPDWVTVKVIHSNAYAKASRHDNQFADWLRDEDPDIVVIVDSPWRYVDAQKWLADRYPYRVEPDPAFEWPMTILSKFPLSPTNPLFEFPQTEPSAALSFTAQRAPLVTLTNGRQLLLTALHPPSPRTARSWRSGLRIAQREAELVRAWRRGTGMGALVTGDFNSTPAGRLHRTFASGSGLTGWTPLAGGGTWPGRFSPWLAFPIDRIWTSPGIVVRSLRIGPKFASDHRPFVAVVCVPPPETRVNENDR